MPCVKIILKIEEVIHFWDNINMWYNINGVDAKVGAVRVPGIPLLQIIKKTKDQLNHIGEKKPQI